MKDRTVNLLIMFSMLVMIVGLVSYALFFHTPDTTQRPQCGPGTVWNAQTGRCEATDTGVAGATGDCDIEDMTLKFRGLLKQSATDGIKYVNTSYYVWQFGEEQGSKSLSVADWGTTGTYHEDITTLTPGYEITLWYGDDDDTAPDHWIRTGSKDTGCQAAVSFTAEVYNESYKTEATGFSMDYYDGGTYEATANESVSAGETVTDSYFKIKESSGDSSVGHPDIDNPIGFCFAYNNSELVYAEVTNGEEFPVPSGLSGTADECWEWDHGHLFDYDSGQVDLALEFKSGASIAVGESVDIYLVTKNYYRDGSGNWKIGWEDDDDNLLGMGDSTSDLDIEYY